MATGGLQLRTANLPQVFQSGASAAASPARKDRADFIRALAEERIKKLKKAQNTENPEKTEDPEKPKDPGQPDIPLLKSAWDFWHDREDRPQKPCSGEATAGVGRGPAPGYEARLVNLADNIIDFKTFWELYNNTEHEVLPKLQQKDSIHLFRKGIKPIWEDPGNVRGGSWTFRVPKDKSAAFWKDLNMLAVLEVLQQAVEVNTQSSNDDICGISYSVRDTSILVAIWNSDGENKKGIANLLRAVMENLASDLHPSETQYYYKKHSEHAGFTRAIK